MRPEFWHQRWRTGQIGFHQSAVDHSLRRHWCALGLASPSCRVFVPLCGKSLDLLWLREQGHFVAGVEISATALESFCLENGVPARRRTLARFDVYEAANLQLFRGDFFALTRELIGEIGAIYDRAALISWAPELRAAYAAHIAELAPSGARMLLVTLEYPQPQMPGPPFSVSGEEVAELFAPHFALEELAREDILAGEARLRAKGVTRLDQVCYQLVRRQSGLPLVG
jgi:thiopurine S-methyltransferase